jgi:hypothetical protein
MRAERYSSMRVDSPLRWTHPSASFVSSRIRFPVGGFPECYTVSQECFERFERDARARLEEILTAEEKVGYRATTVLRSGMARAKSCSICASRAISISSWWQPTAAAPSRPPPTRRRKEPPLPAPRRRVQSRPPTSTRARVDYFARAGTIPRSTVNPVFRLRPLSKKCPNRPAGFTRQDSCSRG